MSPLSRHRFIKLTPTMPTYFDTSTHVGASLSRCRITLSPRPDWGLRLRTSALSCYHFIKPSSSLGYVKTGLGVGTMSRYKLGPSHIKQINQLSRFYAQKLSVLNFVRFDQALYFFTKSRLRKTFFVKTLFLTNKFNYPVYLGASFMKPFFLHIIINVSLHSLFVYYAKICIMLT